MVEVSPRVLVVETLDEVRELFFRTAAGDDFDFDQIAFGPYFNVEFKLPSYSSEMPRQFIRAYHANYRRIYQLIALIENGRADIKTLTKDQQERYEFSVKVAEGSSRLEDNGAEILGKAVGEAFKKMSGNQAVVTVLGVVLLGCTTWGFSAHIAAQKEIRIAEAQAKERVDTVETLTEAQKADIAAMKEIISIMHGSGETGTSAVAAVQDIQDQRLRAMADTDLTIVGDMEITGEEARELRSSSRRRSTEVSVEKEMRVVSVNTADLAETIVVLEDIETGEQTRLRYADRIMGTRLGPVVFAALEKRSTAMFTLRGKLVEDEITYTEIIGADELPSVREAAADEVYEIDEESPRGLEVDEQP